MKKPFRTVLYAAGIAVILSIPAFSQAAKRSTFDVTNYVIDVSLSPNERRLTATADVTFTPLEDTRTVSFELNGSLKIDSITRLNAPMATTVLPASKPPVKVVAPAPKPTPAGQVTFVQDQVGASDLGPSVRVDLGDSVTKGTPVTLRFKYAGVLDGPAGGPLLTKRLAFVGENQGYLMYAARWFPF